MANFDFKIFIKNINNDFAIANSLINKIQKYQFELAFYIETQDIQYEEDIVAEDANDFNKECLRSIIKSIKRKISFAIEYNGLHSFLKEFNLELNNYESDYSELEYESYIGNFYSPVIELLQNYFEAITSQSVDLSSQMQETDFFRLERILKGTPKILYDRKIEPTNEKEVRKEIYNYLIHSFPDTVREIPISKVSKTFKPDIGIKSLKCAIEYKFIDSSTDYKTAISGIFEDIQGYAGSEDWKIFYAVFYMTDHFITEPQIESEFILSNVPHNWKPIIIYGKGQRKNKSIMPPKK